MRSLMLCSFAALTLVACAQPPAPAATGPESATTPAPTIVALAVADAWTRATATGATAAGGYLTINNPTSQADRLVRVSSPRSPRVELHEMRDANGVMEMRQVQGIDVPAVGSVALAPGGLHVMFMELPTPFVAGETVPVTLTFAQAGDVNVVLEVRSIDAVAGPAAVAPAAGAAPVGEAAAHGAGDAPSN
jgi:periplasmic copper chaperone A